MGIYQRALEKSRIKKAIEFERMDEPNPELEVFLGKGNNRFYKLIHEIETNTWSVWQWFINEDSESLGEFNSKEEAIEFINNYDNIDSDDHYGIIGYR